MKIKKYFILLLISTSSFAGTKVSDSIQIGGVVPLVISSSVNLFSTSLIFKQKERVRNRLIGRIFLKYNTPIEAIQISASTPKGLPSDNGVPYPFGQFGFEIRITNCDGVNGAPINFPETEYTPVTIGSNARIKTGVINTCDIIASWDGSDKPTQNTSYWVNYYINLSTVE